MSKDAVTMDQEAEILRCFADLHELAQTINEISLYIDYNSSTEEQLNLKLKFKDLLKSYQEALNMVINLYNLLVE